MTKEQKITESIGWKIWETNFYNAKKFFESKGNGNTKSRLKDKWFNDLKKDLERLERLTRIIY